MSSNSSQSKRDHTVEYARKMLSEQLVIPLVKNCDGMIIEIGATNNGSAQISRWLAKESYLSGLEPDDRPILTHRGEQLFEQPAELAIWLFGLPEGPDSPKIRNCTGKIRSDP